MTPPRVIVSGGGTGGHIFPAIAIANAIKAKHPEAEILFVGAKGRMEMEKVPAAGYRIEGLWISGLQRKLTLQNLAFPLKVVSSLYNARKIIATDISEVTGTTYNQKNTITINDEQPFRGPNYRQNPEQQGYLKAHVDSLLKNGLIERTNDLRYTSPIMIVYKRKPEAFKDFNPLTDTRLVQDLRILNKRMTTMPTQLPSFEEVQNRLAGMTRFSNYDAFNGFWQCRLEKESRKYTAFHVAGLGGFQWCVLPQGMANSPYLLTEEASFSACELILSFRFFIAPRFTSKASFPSASNKETPALPFPAPR